jgi:O-antigen/teichoic acid export membrane protein
VYLISGLTVLLVAVTIIDFDQLLPIGLDRRLFREMLNFTKWVMLGAVAVYFINWGHLFILRVFESLQLISMGDIGSFNLGYQIFKGVVVLTYIIATYFLPFVSANVEDRIKMRDYFYRKRPKILVMGLVLIGAFFVVVPYAFRIAYGDLYQGSVTVLRILLIASALILYSVFYDPVLHALKRYRFAQMINVLQILLSLFVAMLLVPLMGLAGAAVATVSAYLLRAVAMEVYFRSKLKRLFNV